MQHTALLNQELKNPHLVETMVTIEPTTGRKVQVGYDHKTWITEVRGESPEWTTYKEKMEGNIPRIELNFNIQGVPIILTAQSYLTIRLTPKLKSEVVTLKSIAGSPLQTDFEIDRSGWPKLNSLVVEKTQATISNFGTESYFGFFNNYIRSLRLSEEIRNNMSRQFNNNYCVPTFNSLFTDASSVSTAYQTIEYRTRYADEFLYSCSLERVGNAAIQWTKDNSFEIRIPLSEVLPIFQVPVIPLKQTNTSGIQLRMFIYSPRHMFFMSRSFRSNVIWNNRGPNVQNFTGLKIGQTTLVKPSGTTSSYNGLLLASSGTTSTDDTLIGFDRRMYENFPSSSIVISDEQDFFACDLDAEVFLNLKVLTDPLLNPLAEAYIQPFINEANEFRSKYETTAIYNQTLKLFPNLPAIFRFTPSRLFYNATQLGLFFFTMSSRWKNDSTNGALTTTKTEVTTRPFNSVYTELNPAAGPIHGYYSLPPTVDISEFQIGLSSSATPLFDRPLDKLGMFSATEDCFKKYGPSEMFGKIVQIRKRMTEGDAFFLFDLTHTRDSGYFIDADNMISVGGTLLYQPGNYSAAANTLQLNDHIDLQVILVIFYQETFTVLLDLEGSVLLQQM